MSKAKWIVSARYETKEELYEFYRKHGENPEDYAIGEYNGVEICVVREDNEHGKKSYGWGGKDKIILYSCDSESECTREDIDWWEKVAITMCDALNRKGL